MLVGCAKLFLLIHRYVFFFQVSVDEEKKYITKSKRVSQFSSPSKPGKSTKLPENSSSSTDPGKATVDVAEAVPHVSFQTHSITKSKNRRKRTLYKATNSKEIKSFEGAGENQFDKFTTNESTIDFKVRRIKIQFLKLNGIYY